MDAGNIKKKYRDFKKEYNLPSFEKLDLMFELSTIDKDDFLLRNIRKKMLEKLDYFCEIIESLLQPDTSSFANMHECKFFEDEEKDDLYKLYKNLMFLSKSAMLLGINSSDDEEAEFINSVYKDLPKLQQEILVYVKKIKETWRNESSTKEELGYLG